MTQFHLIKPGTLTVGTYNGFAPVSWCDSDGSARGRDIEFLRAFASKWNLDIVFNFYPFDKIWERTSNNEIDIAAAGIAPLKSRQKSGILWSEPYYYVKRSLLIRASDKEQYKTIDDFDGKRIVVTTGSTAQLDTEQRKPSNATIVYYDGHQHEVVKQLLDGTIDAFAEGDICSTYLATRVYPGQLDVTDVHMMDEPEEFTFALREPSGDLLDMLNAFIRDHYKDY